MSLEIGKAVRVRLSGLTLKRSDDDTFFYGVITKEYGYGEGMRAAYIVNFIVTKDIEEKALRCRKYRVGAEEECWVSAAFLEEATPDLDPDFDETKGDF